MVDEWICWEEVLERVHEGEDGEGGLLAADGGHERVPEEIAHEDVVDTGQRIADSAEGLLLVLVLILLRRLMRGGLLLSMGQLLLLMLILLRALLLLSWGQLLLLLWRGFMIGFM